jgi:hypothetical protein
MRMQEILSQVGRRHAPPPEIGLLVGFDGWAGQGIAEFFHRLAIFGAIEDFGLAIAFEPGDLVLGGRGFLLALLSLGGIGLGWFGLRMFRVFRAGGYEALESVASLCE